MLVTWQCVTFAFYSCYWQESLDEIQFTGLLPQQCISQEPNTVEMLEFYIKCSGMIFKSLKMYILCVQAILDFSKKGKAQDPTKRCLCHFP